MRNVVAHTMIGFLLITSQFGDTSVSIAAPSVNKPNILVFLADDMGWGDSPAYNPYSKIAMPNIDQLAAQGMIFSDAHTSAAHCAPTRYSILTGNYHWRGFRSYGQWEYKGGSQILEGQWTIGNVLQQRGYTTAFLGKMHLGGDFYRIGSDDFVAHPEPDDEVDFSRRFVSGPLDHGFNYSFLALRGIQDVPFAYFENDQLFGDPAELMTWTAGTHGDSIIPKNGGIGMPYWDSSQVGPELTEKAIEFIDLHHQTNLVQGTDTPFFLYYASQSAHHPHTPPVTFLGDPVRGVTGMTNQTDMIYEIDVALGKLVEALEQRGIADNTIIVFTSDNGGLQNQNNAGHDHTGGLRGIKSMIGEGGHRVPLIVKWGDGLATGSLIPPGTISNQLIGTHDLMATLAALAGANLPIDQARDSFNFLPVLMGTRGDAEPIRDHIIMEALRFDDRPDKANHFGYREGSWKLVFDQYENVMGLYNLADDPTEMADHKDDPIHADRLSTMVSNFFALKVSDRTAPILPDPPDGDINLDGQVNVADLLLGMQVIVGSITLTSEQLARGDVAPLVANSPFPDGLFNLGDYLVLIRIVLGQLVISQ